MATQESLDRVQQLYVAYYGRPADQEGQEYWADRLDAEGEGAIINAFGNSEEYAAKAEGQGNATLINAIYQQAFNRGADPEGLAYYAGVLERGEKTLAEIATTIINAAGGIDAQTFNARVEAAAAYTAEFGAAADYDLEAAIAAVEAAKPGVNASALTEALTTLKTAQDAREDFLEEAYESNDFVKSAADTAAGAGNEPTADQIADAINDGTAGEYFDASAAVNTELANFGADVTGFAGRADAVQDAAIEEGVAAAVKVVSDHQDGIAEVEGLGLAIRNYNNAVQAAEAAADALAVASAEATGQINAFDARSNDVTDTALDAAPIDAATEVTATVDGNTLTTIMTVDNGEFVIEAAYAEVAGINELRDALQAHLDAFEADASAQQRVTDTSDVLTTDFADLSDSDFLDGKGYADGLDVANALSTAEEALSDLNDAVARFESARELSDELETLDKSVTEATDAIMDSEEDGGLGVNLITDYSAATADDDVYLFAENANPQTIADFSDSGEDRIFFGDEYVLVELESDWAASANTGDSSALEIFWEQNGNHLTLYVESKAFAGNGSTAGDITEIELTGVNASEIDFSGGYLTAGEPA